MLQVASYASFGCGVSRDHSLLPSYGSLYARLLVERTHTCLSPPPCPICARSSNTCCSSAPPSHIHLHLQRSPPPKPTRYGPCTRHHIPTSACEHIARRPRRGLPRRTRPRTPTSAAGGPWRMCQIRRFPLTSFTRRANEGHAFSVGEGRAQAGRRKLRAIQVSASSSAMGGTWPPLATLLPSRCWLLGKASLRG